jgi:hypothetical protein
VNPGIYGTLKSNEGHRVTNDGKHQAGTGMLPFNPHTSFRSTPRLMELDAIVAGTKPKGGKTASLGEIHEGIIPNRPRG